MKDWNGSNHSCFVTNGDTNHTDIQRDNYDYYATDPTAVKKILDIVKFNNNVLEPCCGGGHISEVLKNYGYNVTSYDIVNRGYEGQSKEVDFLIMNQKWGGDIVTNPPYKFAKEFVEHSLNIIEDGNKVAMFLKLTFLEGDKRKSLFKNQPPKDIYVFTKRVNCALNGDEKQFKASSAVCYAWFIWEKGYKGKPSINWI